MSGFLLVLCMSFFFFFLFLVTFRYVCIYRPGSTYVFTLGERAGSFESNPRRTIDIDITCKKNTSSMVNPSVLSLLCLASPSPGAERNKGKWKPRKCSFFSNHHAVRVRKTNKKTIFPGSMHAVHVGEQTLKRRQRCGAEDEEVEVVEENNRKKKGSIVVKKSDSFIASGQRRGRRPIRQTRQKERPTAKARRRLQEEHLRIR